ncbi:MAG: radical SAM protein [Betaproteobacteria bacterium]|nr:radical SAM protein [Betaproteobacteria bacterium]
MKETPYRIAVNVEWTSKCNARCAMCPRSMIAQPRIMELATFRQTLSRLSPDLAFRVIIAGYGEPTTHPRFDDFVEALRGHPLRFDMATNGSRLDEERLMRMDGLFTGLMISFSSTDPEVYRSVHANLDQAQVMENILLAHRTLKATRLVINLSPTAECLATLPGTVAWFRRHGIDSLHMSPTYYDRAGAIRTDGVPSERDLRAKIRAYGFASQEMAFIPGVGDIIGQWRHNRFKCIPRNTSMLIDAGGNYTYCFNDIRHSHPIGHVSDMSLGEAIALRQAEGPDAAICSQCNLRRRYRPRELARVALSYANGRLKEIRGKSSTRGA